MRSIIKDENGNVSMLISGGIGSGWKSWPHPIIFNTSNPKGGSLFLNQFEMVSEKWDGNKKELVPRKKTKFEMEEYSKVRGLYFGSVSNLVNRR